MHLRDASEAERRKMLRSLARLALRLAAVAAVTVGAGVLADRFVAGEGQAFVVWLAFFGSLAFFSAENFDSVIWMSHGLYARGSPVVVFRILGVIVWAWALLCLSSWRDQARAKPPASSRVGRPGHSRSLSRCPPG